MLSGESEIEIAPLMLQGAFDALNVPEI